MEKTRIQKIIADSGYCSRRKAESLIAAGQVKCNGRPVKLGDKAGSRDLITVNGERIAIPKKKQKLYLMLNKPRGYVTTMSDELDRRCVMDLLEDVPERVYPVGRLDRNSEGLLLLTNDGALTHRLLTPKNHVDKVYYARTEGTPTAEDAARLAQGITLPDGLRCLPAELKICGEGEVHLTLREGKFHQAKRMLAACGTPVVYLKRLSMGPLTLENTLPAGDFRHLTEAEIDGLRRAAGLMAADCQKKDNNFC